MLRVVIDTQVWVRAFLRPTGSSGTVRTRLLEGQFECLTSDPLLNELAEVLRRPKFERKHGKSRELQRRFVSQLRQAVVLVEVDEPVAVCRDPDDDVVISVALAGAAVYVVSEDEDLHAAEVREYLTPRGIEVLTVPEFLGVLREDRLAEGSSGVEPSDA
jgi:putative PIN family toxin of toxin-antitoxin system